MLHDATKCALPGPGAAKCTWCMQRCKTCAIVVQHACIAGLGPESKMHSADPSRSKHLWHVSTSLQPLADSPAAPVVTQEPTGISNPSRRLRLPGFVQKLRTQYPPAGMFNVHDLDWEFVGTGKQMGLVAAFPRQRLHDFRMGESHRAGCKVLIGSYKATTESVLLNDRGLCVFGAPSYAVGKKRQAAPAEPASNSHTDCGVARYGKTPDSQSKKNCAYCCYARVYAKCQDVVIVKFPCYEGDTPETCMTMKHCTPDGESAHVGVEGHRHLRQWSTEATSLIIAKLKLHVKPSVIIQDVKKSILHWLNIPEDSPPEETREVISASRFGKDFYVNNSRIQYLRRKYVEPAGACSSGTAATAGTPDDSSATAAPAACPRPMHDGVSEGAPAATDAAADHVQHTVLRALASAAVPNAHGQGMGAQAPRSAAASALGDKLLYSLRCR